MESENTVAKLEKTRSLADFLQQKRKIFIGSLSAVIGAIAVFFIAAGVLDADTKKKLAALEGLIEHYDKLADSIGNEAADAGTNAEIETLRGDLQTFAESARGYPGAKAWSLVGTIYAKEKKWADAENAFEQSAIKGAKTHLSGPSLFNAGVAAEEGGNVAKAIDYFSRSIGTPASLIGARAQFSIGRLQEAQGDREAARLAYRKVVEDYPDSSGETWRNLAQSRLIVLDGN
ncbi:MAG: tetratricopeptide repeat protein [Spirochaetaceae bacterium]|jgi:tetratricopeptide (TPR) repeat protein|nr:tetratricopeptide repeat protein [Spirochaetaceae bacterium]